MSERIDYTKLALSKPPPKKKKSKLQKRKDDHNSKYWLKKADKEWGRAIHEEYKSRCLVCEETGEAHHLVSRAVRWLRHKKENGIILCPLHHKWSPWCSAHGGPIAFSEWLRRNYLDKYEWVLENKGLLKQPYNYQEAYLRLTNGNKGVGGIR